MSNIDWSLVITKEMKLTEKHEAAAQTVTAQVAVLRTECSSIIDSYTDLIDMGDGTPEDEAKLLSWRQYRTLLLKIPKQPGYPFTIEWPVKPE